MSIKVILKNYVEFTLFQILKLFLPRFQVNNNKLLLVNTGLLGDLVISSILLENPEIFNKYETITFIINDKHQNLFSNYNGKVNIVGFNYKKYKFNLIYKFRFLSFLRKEGFKTCIHLTAARGILNEELVHLCGAKELISINSTSTYLGKILGNYFNKRYSRFIAKNTINEYDKHFELMSFINGDMKDIVLSRGIVFDENREFSFKYCNNCIAIAPFSSLMNKDWKDKYFIEIINYLKVNYKILLFGTYEQKERLEVLKNFDNNISIYAGTIELKDIPQILTKMKLVIGLDSGIMHIALKVGVPMLAIIGGGGYGRFFPYQETNYRKYLYSKMDCFSCDWECTQKEKYCLTNVTPNEVVESLEKLLDK